MAGRGVPAVTRLEEGAAKGPGELRPVGWALLRLGRSGCGGAPTRGAAGSDSNTRPPHRRR